LTTVRRTVRAFTAVSTPEQTATQTPFSRLLSHMKLHADKLDFQSITAYGPGWLAVNGQRHTNSLVLASTGLTRPWACNRFEALQASDFESLLTTGLERPELVVFGSGQRLRFVRPALVACLMEQRIGLETMDTAAACRTYNILAAEGRRVVAALLLEN
jgi:uncharacterized protein